MTDDGRGGQAASPASHLVRLSIQRVSYAAAGFANQNVADTHDGLNQVTASGGATITHDARGNITSDGTRTYGYSSENRLTSVGGAGAYTYDPLGRLAATPAGYFAVHDGDRMTEEYNTSGGRSAVYVPGPAMDEALASIGYLGDRYYLIADERGSVLNHVNESGVHWGTFEYDEYGMIMQVGGRWFSYTGQLHLPESGLLYYKARMYHPGLGRFLQPDPIGYGDGMNLYGYVSGDPVNFTDPMGLAESCDDPKTPEMEVCGRRSKAQAPFWNGGGGSYVGWGGFPPGQALAEVAGDALPVEGPEMVSTCDREECRTNNPARGRTRQPGRQSPLPPGCQPAYGGRYYMQCGNGGLQFTPEYQERVCSNYQAMSRSNSEISAIITIGGGPASVFSPAIFSAPNIIMGIVTSLLGLSSTPEGCS